MGRGYREALELFVTGVLGIAFLAGLSPFVNLLTGPLGAIFAIAALVGALFFMIVAHRRRRNLSIATLELVLWGVFCFGFSYGPMWYFISYVPSLGPSFWEIKLPQTTPRPTLTAEATLTPRPTLTARPTLSPVPTQTPKPTNTPSLTPVPRVTAKPTATATKRR